MLFEPGAIAEIVAPFGINAITIEIITSAYNTQLCGLFDCLPVELPGKAR